MERYISVIIPWESDPKLRTIWHPTDPKMAPLSRGAFATEAEAQTWVDANLRPDNNVSFKTFEID